MDHSDGDAIDTPVGPPASPTVGELTDDLAAEHEALDALVCSLRPEAWTTATPAEGWTVADQIGHLGFFDHAAVLAATDEKAFRAQVADALERGGDLVDEALAAPRSMTPSELLTWWRDARSQLISTARTMKPDDRIAWYGPDMGSRSFLTARLMETWAHGHDIADAVQITLEPTDRVRHIAQLGVITRGWSYMVRGQEAPPAPVRVELNAPSGARWGWGDPEASDRVTGPAVDFAMVTTQRRNVADTGLVVVGDAAGDWMRVAQAFAGAPTGARPPKGTSNE